MKKNARTFSKNPTTQENIRISRLKRRLRNLYNKDHFKPDLSNTLDKTLAAISSAFIKAFDKVDQDFSFSVISFFSRKFGCRNKFIHMIQVTSINIQSKIKINGLLSESLTLFQGFHQGCPLSMLLCNIVAEILAISIDANMRIEGIQIGDHEIKIVNFADNTTIFFRDFICLTKIELILKLPPKVSSSKIKFFKKPVL